MVRGGVGVSIIVCWKPTSTWKNFKYRRRFLILVSATTTARLKRRKYEPCGLSLWPKIRLAI